jgi:hypothetical protein
MKRLEDIVRQLEGLATDVQDIAMGPASADRKILDAYEQCARWGATIVHNDGKVCVSLVVKQQPLIQVAETLTQAVDALQGQVRFWEAGEKPGANDVVVPPPPPGKPRSGVYYGLPQFPGLWQIPLCSGEVEYLRTNGKGEGGRQLLVRTLYGKIIGGDEERNWVLPIDTKQAEAILLYTEGDDGYSRGLRSIAASLRQAQAACLPESLLDS